MKTKFAYIAIAFLLFLLSDLPVKSQQFAFNRVPLFEENVRGFITGMAQDAKGYMWFTEQAFIVMMAIGLLPIKMIHSILSLSHLQGLNLFLLIITILSG